MKNSKLFQILLSLTPKQTLSLKKFVLSKVSIATDVYKIFSTLLTLTHSKNIPERAKDFQALFFPQLKIKIVSNNVSILFSYTEEWIVLEYLRDHVSSKDLIVQKWLNKNSLYHLADKSKVRIFTKDDNESGHNMEDLISRVDSLFDQLFSSNPEKFIPSSNSFEELMILFDELVLCQYYIILNELTNRENITHTDLSKYKSTIHKRIKTYKDSNLSSILQLLNNLIENESLEAFELLKNALLDNQLRPGSNLQITSTHYLINKSTQLWSKGKIKDLKVIISLVNYGMETGIYFINGKISTIRFHNLIMQMCQSLTYNQMVKFIDKWLDKVNSSRLEGTKDLALAQVAFYNNRYRDIELNNWKNRFDSFTSKNLAQGLHLVKCFMNREKEYDHYETSMLSSIYFLKRNKNKMSDYLFSSYMNLIEFMKNIDKGNTVNIDLINPLLYRKWCTDIVQKKSK